jgi:hypothetical protein
MMGKQCPFRWLINLLYQGEFCPVTKIHIPVTQSDQFWQVILCLARPSGFPVASFQANLSPAEPTGKAGDG